MRHARRSSLCLRRWLLTSILRREDASRKRTIRARLNLQRSDGDMYGIMVSGDRCSRATLSQSICAVFTGREQSIVKSTRVDTSHRCYLALVEKSSSNSNLVKVQYPILYTSALCCLPEPSITLLLARNFHHMVKWNDCLPKIQLPRNWTTFAHSTGPSNAQPCMSGTVSNSELYLAFREESNWIGTANKKRKRD